MKLQNDSEKLFRRVINRIGIAMLLFLAILNILAIIWNITVEILSLSISGVRLKVIEQLLYAVIYLASFMIPALILKKLLGKDYRPMMLEPKIPADSAAYVFAGIALILSMAVINSMFVSIFNYSEFSSEFLWGNEPMSNYEVVLAFITTAMVPAFCEEFLFRGAILSSLKPFGKAPAIIISAVLFGLMHQNAEQLLYATAAGLVLGFVVYETGSMWCSILIHFINNFISVLQTSVLDRLPSYTGTVVSYVFQGTLFAVGICCLVYLVTKKSKEKKLSKALLDDGIYGKTLEELADGSEAVIKLRSGRMTKLFFSPAMIVFIVLSALTMAYYILLSVLNGMGVQII